MTLKITLTIDQENEQGVILIGLLAKAFGRAEAGVSDLRIEREGERVRTAAPKLSGIERKVAEIAERPKRKGYELGMRARDGRPNGVILMLQVLARNGTLKDIHAAWKEAGFVADGGVGATLSKLKKRGLAKHLGPAKWRITPDGLATLHKFDGKEVSDESRSDGSVSGE